MIKTKIESGIDILEASQYFSSPLPPKKMAIRAIGVSSFPSSSYFTRKAEANSSTLPLCLRHGQCMQQMVGKPVTSRRIIACSAVQESSTPTVAAETKEVKPAQEKGPAKPKPPAKAPAKPLPQMMEEDVIPSLKSTLEAQDDLSEIELSFQDNRLEGSFQKKGIPYSFWAFFPNGVLTGPKGFSLSSYGSGSSTVEPFLIDEKRITTKHVVFWVEKRLAAQGIIPVWKE